ncbi:activator-dependent family glycosyltransferase [Micromonospora sp. DT229]|uniref:activator-dependent family glycosyltransferase n=1 Tax=Micromonospora sp. DT229 TaxID=3393430 RepID=UPI003CE94DE7
MKVLFTCFAAPTHFYSLVPLAWALRTAGHEVRVASQPDLADTITQAGLTAVPVGPAGWFGVDAWAPELLGQTFPDSLDFVRDFDYTGNSAQQWSLRQLLELEYVTSSGLYATTNSDPMIDGLTTFANEWRPDLVIWEMYTFAGAIAARVSGAAHARFLWAPDIAVRARHTMLRLAERQPAAHRHDPTAEWLGECLARFGSHFDEEVVTGHWSIDMTPPSMRLDVGLRTVGMRYVPYNGPSVLPDWLRTPPERSRICLTFGLSSRTDGQPISALDQVLGSLSLGDLFDAVRGLDAEIVLTVAPELLTGVRLPDNVQAVGFVPLNDLLPTCSAILHQGGSGSRSTSEVHGVPQLMLFDPWDAVRGQGVAGSGAGLAIPRAEITADLLRDSLHRLLNDPSFAEGARRVQREVLAEPTPNELVPVLERLTAQYRTADNRVSPLGGARV